MDTDMDSMTLRVSNKELAVEILKSFKSVMSAKIVEDEINFIVKHGEVNKILNELILKDIYVEEIYKNRKGLEQRYMELVEGSVR